MRKEKIELEDAAAVFITASLILWINGVNSGGVPGSAMLQIQPGTDSTASVIRVISRSFKSPFLRNSICNLVLLNCETNSMGSD